MTQFLNTMGRLPGAFVIALVRLYQLCISPWLGPNCRYHPSCSSYMILAVQKYGCWRGICRGAWRICRCHPFGSSGYDPP